MSVSASDVLKLIGDWHPRGWKGKVIVVVCGDSQRDLVNAVTKKVDSFRADFLTELFEEKKIHLVVWRSGKPKESSGW